MEKIERNEDVIISTRKLSGLRKTTKELEEADFDFNTFVANHPSKFRPASTFTHYKRKQIAEFIGRIETFESDFSSLCQKIGFKDYSTESKKRTLTQKDPSAKNTNDYHDMYTRKSIRLINRALKDDFKLLGYEKH